MIDYSFDYDGTTYKVPKAKIFETLYAIGEIAPVAALGEVFSSNNFMKAAKIFALLGDYAGQKFDPIDVTKHYLYKKGGSAEIYMAIGGLVALLNPPEDFQPPENKELGK